MKFLALALLAVAVAEVTTAPAPRRRVDDAVVDEDEPEVNDRQKRIINGRRACPGKYTSVVTLQVLRKDGKWHHGCGGFIFNTQTVVTAAHCLGGLSPDEMRIRAGEYNLFLNETREQEIPVKSIHPHPGFILNSTLGYPNDIGVLRLNSSLKINEFVQLADLAEDEDECSESPESSESKTFHPKKPQKPKRPKKPSKSSESSEDLATLVGWGYTERADGPLTNDKFVRAEKGYYPIQLHDLTLGIISNEECEKMWLGDRVQETNICFFEPGKMAGSCFLDSGSPAYVGDKVVGVTSWGPKPCGSLPSVYTRVSKYTDWMKANAA